MAEWRLYNPSPAGRNVGDCAVRAIAKALGIDWEAAYATLTFSGYQMADMPSSNAVINAVLRKNGFYRTAIPDRCPVCYTAEDFLNDNPDGVFVLSFGNHIATAEDGVLYDSWNSLKEIPTDVYYRKGVVPAPS